MKFFIKYFLLISFVFFIFSIVVFANDFYSTGFVYNFNATSGDATTPNSYGTANVFRRLISGQIASSIYAVDYFTAESTAALFQINTDTPWRTDPSPGQNATAVVEVIRGVNGYSGAMDYVGAINHTISETDVLNGYFLFDNDKAMFIQPIPTPEYKSKTENSITIKWTGIATSDASGTLINSVETYAVYYATSESGPFTFAGLANHVSGEVNFTHSGLNYANTYYYKLKLRYFWPENNPNYYETTATSPTSEGIKPLSPSPVVSSISPNRVINEGIKTFLINGDYFTGANRIDLVNSGTYITTTTAVSVLSDTQIVTTLELDPAQHFIGTWDVRVTVGDVYGTGSNLLTITSEAPVISSISPITGGTNTTINGFTIYGQRLYGGSGTAITLTKEGFSTISATGITTSAGYTSMTCTLPLTNATIGNWSVNFTNMFGATATSYESFVVTAEAPTVISITPDRGSRGGTVHISSLSGSNLFKDSVVMLRKIGETMITATNIVANLTNTSLSFDLSIPSNASTGTWDVIVINSDGKVVTKEGFFLVTAAPIISVITPESANNSGPTNVVISGGNFFVPVSARLEKTGYSTIPATIISSSDSSIVCNFDLTNVMIGSWDVVVENNDGIARLVNGLTVTSEAPVFTSINPNYGYGGYTSSFTISGNRFYSGVEVELRKTGRPTLSASSVTVSDINTINCEFSLPNTSADVGMWDIYIRNIDDKSTSESSVFRLDYGQVSTPSACTVAPLSTTSVKVTWQDNSGNEELFRIEKYVDGVWTQVGTVPANVTEYTGSGTTGLSVNTGYLFRVRAEGGGQVSGYSTSEVGYTYANEPIAVGFSEVKATRMTINWGANGNPAWTNYYCENTTNSTNSGVINAYSWTNTGLLAGSTYTYRVRAINGNGIPTGWVVIGSQQTLNKSSIYYFEVDKVKLLSGDILGSNANITVVVSSESALDLSTFRLYIDGREVTDGTNTYYDSYESEGNITKITYKIRNALSEGTYVISARVIDNDGMLYEGELNNLQVMAEGSKTVVGHVLPYPNPYDPVKGNVKITYRLATDTNVTIYVFDVTGKLVWKNNYQSGFNGGKAGYNEVEWNGFDNFNNMLTNDVYLIRIVESGTGRVMGKGKLVIVKSLSEKEDNKSRLAFGFIDGDNLKRLRDSGRIILLTMLGAIVIEELIKVWKVIRKADKDKRDNSNRLNGIL